MPPIPRPASRPTAFVTTLLLTASFMSGCRIGYEDLSQLASNSSSGSATSGGSHAAGSTPNLGGNGDDNTGGVDSNAGGDGDVAGSSASGASSAGQPTAGSAGDTGGTDTGGTDTGGTSAGGTSTGGTGQPGPCRSATYGGHDYEMCDSGAAYAPAKADCESRGLRLARIDDAAENVWVHSMIPAADQANNNTSLWRWLGADDLVTLGDWQWTDGATFWTGGNKGMPVGGAYANWTRNQPLNPHCLAMQASNGFWYAMDCAAARPYVCELY